MAKNLTTEQILLAGRKLVLRNALVRYRKEIWPLGQGPHAHENEPETVADTLDDVDWNDMNLGFLLACGVPFHDASDWGLLSAMTCGEWDKLVKYVRALKPST
jgi:hypothetical protein